MSMNILHWIVIAAVTLPGMAGCYTSSRGNSSLPDADSTMEPDASRECLLWHNSHFVDYVQSVSQPADGFVLVTIQGGQQFQLDVQTPLGEFWAEILDQRREEHQPVYIEVDDARTMMIIDVVTPLESPVHDIQHAAEGTEVQLIYSAAIHFLYLSHPCYDEILAALETSLRNGSLLLVCTDYNDGNKILDARPPLGP